MSRYTHQAIVGLADRVLGEGEWRGLTDFELAQQISFELDLPSRTTISDQLDLIALVLRFCRVCGCTDAAACPGACAWVERDLCSECSRRTAESRPWREGVPTEGV